MARRPARPRKKRDYKAEYAARIARAAKSGKTRQQARGHKAKEHVVRAQRAKAKYGASPATLTKLRAQARDRLLAVYYVTARGRVRPSTVARGMRLLHADDLRAIIEWDDIEVVNMKNQASPLHPGSDNYYEALAQYFPASIDDLEGFDQNPGWYK